MSRSIHGITEEQSVLRVGIDVYVISILLPP